MARIIRTDISKMQSDRVFAKDNNFIDRISALKDIGEVLVILMGARHTI